MKRLFIFMVIGMLFASCSSPVVNDYPEENEVPVVVARPAEVEVLNFTMETIAIMNHATSEIVGTIRNPEDNPKDITIDLNDRYDIVLGYGCEDEYVVQLNQKINVVFIVVYAEENNRNLHICFGDDFDAIINNLDEATHGDYWWNR